MTLNEYQLENAKNLLECLKPYSTKHSKSISNILEVYIKNQKGNLADLITSIELPKEHTLYSLYDDINVNAIHSQILYPEQEYTVN